MQLQKLMKSQGIEGPQYKLLHGNTKEANDMNAEAMKKTMELSHDIFPKVLPHIHAWMKLYGRNVLTWHGPKAQLVLTEPELIKEVLNNKDGVFPKTDVDDYVKKLLGYGLATSEGKKWARQRKLANRAFHGEMLKGMIPTMISSAEIMLDGWRKYEGKEMEVFEEFRVLTSDVISKTAFGSSYLEGKDIFEMLMKLGDATVRNFRKIRFPVIGKIIRTSDDIESDKLDQGMRKSIIKMIRYREEKLKEDSDAYGSGFLGLLVRAYKEADENLRISLEDVIDECKTFYLGGHETTADLLTWAVLLLAMHTDWQDKARKEVIELFGDKTLTLDDNSIPKMKMINMVINETLRLYPPVSMITRKVAREAKLGKYVLPPNMEVLIPILAIHSDPKIWGKDVHLFNPERFSEGVMKATNNSMGFLPFGLGPRICAGMNFATAEAKVALSMILQRYAFTLSPAYAHSPFQKLTIWPQHGAQIIIHSL
ncbi:hypothetical protein MRB53_032449 [Persea americana]|uniref:Uncharacterized protein n=1 Tax=Persea americana TaxID=3435 RepID=A0ACC2KRU2_PERAE|nr:hypothetical protein MRB53_032449 [Persea americana]